MGHGQFTVTLRHEPDKSAQGVSAGDITNAGGETDIEVSLICMFICRTFILLLICYSSFAQQCKFTIRGVVSIK